ncbi:hypothetical protein pb186bvf_018594 [Paramecium bursaria]
MNPGGSMKDRTALALIKEGYNLKKLQTNQTKIYEGTSGSTGISLALLGNYFGLQTHVFLPDDLAQEKYNLLEVLNAKLMKVRPVSIVDSKHFCRIAEDQAKNDDAYFADQFHNLANYKTHFQTGKEIWDQTLGLIDCFVMSAGTGGSIAGISQYLKEKNKNVKVVLADPPGSSLRNHVMCGLCYTDEEAEGHRKKHPFDTVVEGVGLNRLTKNYQQALIDYAFTISDEESRQTAQLLIQEGLFVGGSSAMNCAAVIKATKQFPELNVFVTILCDQGSRYLILMGSCMCQRPNVKPHSSDDKERITVSEKLKESGNEYFKNQQLHEAIRCYSEAISIHEDSIYYSNRGTVYRQLQNYKQAEQDAVIAITLNQQNVRAHFLFGTIQLINASKSYSLDQIDLGLRELKKSGELCHHKPDLKDQINYNIQSGMKLKQRLIEFKEREHLQKYAQTQQTKITLSPSHNVYLYDAFNCTITQDLMKEPLLDQFGHTYDADALNQNFKVNSCIDPITRNRITLPSIHNIQLQQAIQDYMKNQIDFK